MSDLTITQSFAIWMNKKGKMNYLAKERTMNLLKMMMFGLFMLTTPLMLSACDQNNSAEEAVEEIGDEIDDATTN